MDMIVIDRSIDRSINRSIDSANMSEDFRGTGGQSQSCVPVTRLMLVDLHVFLLPDVKCACRQLFYELRVAVEVMCSKPQCPRFVANVCYKSIGLISRMAPAAN